MNEASRILTVCGMRSSKALRPVVEALGSRPLAQWRSQDSNADSLQGLKVSVFFYKCFSLTKGLIPKVTQIGFNKCMRKPEKFRYWDEHLDIEYEIFSVIFAHSHFCRFPRQADKENSRFKVSNRGEN